MFLFFLFGVAVFVGVVFPEVLVIVTGVASVSGPLAAPKIAWLGPIELFHIVVVLSLALFPS